MSRWPSKVSVGGQVIGNGARCFVIAEGGVNHNGRIELALRLVDAAADAGADAIKFQAFDPDALVTARAPRAPYQRRMGRTTQHEMLRGLVLPPQALAKLSDRARARKLVFLVTPFDERSLTLVAGVGVPAIKLGSGEVTNLPLLRSASRTGLPVLLSTGLSTLPEIDAAVRACRKAGCRKLILFHCVSAYPSPINEMNVRALGVMRARYGVPVGLSDHSEGLAASTAAVALGAAAVEKHITTDKHLQGPDHTASLDPGGFREFVTMLRQVEASLGDGVKRCMPAEHANLRHVRRSCVAAVSIARGTRIRAEHLIMKRPQTGIPSSAVDQIVGLRVRRDIDPDEILTWRLLAR
jgi:sialic acid synthase SpsE